LKNTHLLRYAHPSSLRRTGKYASFLSISRALHLDVFDQPGENIFSITYSNVAAKKDCRDLRAIEILQKHSCRIITSIRAEDNLA